MSERRILYIGNKLGHNPSATPTTLDTLSRQLAEEGFAVRSASGKRNKAVRLLNMLWAVVRNRSWADVVLIDTYSTQNFFYAVAIGNLCRLFKIPYIPILHGGDLPNRLERSPSQSYKLFHGARVNVAPSKYLMEHFRKAGYQNLTYIPNTIDLNDYPYKERQALKPKLLWVRSFAEIYNPMLALKVLKALRDKGHDASLCMVGPDKDGSLVHCKQYAEEQGLPVSFTGKLTKQEWISLATDYDIFINTTNFDNMPVSLLEAMALGLPVVSTNVGGIPYIITHKETGWMVSPDDPDAFVEVISYLLENPSEGVRVQRQARQLVDTFDWVQIKAKWISLLTE